MNIEIPVDVPPKAQKEYLRNYAQITHDTGKLMLFSCDQKIEHLNADFYSSKNSGIQISTDAMHPEHLFRIASQGYIGAMATHPGLIARYSNKYPGINYIAKLNGKTNIVKMEQRDPISAFMWDVDDIIKLKQDAKINICGVGLTVYLGSEFEHIMLEQAAQSIMQAHKHGLITILWMYPRGKSISDTQDIDLLAGAAGVANALGSDFVKIKPPKKIDTKNSAELLRIIVAAAGNTKVLCSGGQNIEPEMFFQELYEQIHTGGTAGNATGRNILQKSLADAIAMTRAIMALVLENATVANVLQMYKNR